MPSSRVSIFIPNLSSERRNYCALKESTKLLSHIVHVFAKPASCPPSRFTAPSKAARVTWGQWPSHSPRNMQLFRSLKCQILGSVAGCVECLVIVHASIKVQDSGAPVQVRVSQVHASRTAQHLPAFSEWCMKIQRESPRHIRLVKSAPKGGGASVTRPCERDGTQLACRVWGLPCPWT
jgi:hypothetical protein